MMTESREHWSSWDSLYTLSEDTLGEEMEAWETFQFNSLEQQDLLWAPHHHLHHHHQSTGDLQAPHNQCEECQVGQRNIYIEPAFQLLISFILCIAKTNAYHKLLNLATFFSLLREN